MSYDLEFTEEMDINKPKKQNRRKKIFKTCSVYQCGKNTEDFDSNGDKLSFHEFPSNPGLRETWIRNISRQGNVKGSEWVPNDKSLVCSVHFMPTDFKNTSSIRRLLKLNAVPTLFPSYPKYKQPKIIKPRRLIVKQDTKVPKSAAAASSAPLAAGFSVPPALTEAASSMSQDAAQNSFVGTDVQCLVKIERDDEETLDNFEKTDTEVSSQSQIWLPTIKVEYDEGNVDDSARDCGRSTTDTEHRDAATLFCPAKTEIKKEAMDEENKEVLSMAQVWLPSVQMECDDEFQNSYQEQKIKIEINENIDSLRQDCRPFKSEESSSQFCSKDVDKNCSDSQMKSLENNVVIGGEESRTVIGGEESRAVIGCKDRNGTEGWTAHTEVDIKYEDSEFKNLQNEFIEPNDRNSTVECDEQNVKSPCYYSKVKSYTCKICKYSTKFKTHIKNHLKRIHNIRFLKKSYYTCNFCYEMYKSRSIFTDHIKYHINQQKQSSCNCKLSDKIFKDFESFEKHLLLHKKVVVEEGTELKICKICSTSYITLKSLKKHLMLEHRPRILDEKSIAEVEVNNSVNGYACQICPKRYFRKCDLEDHMKYHSNDLTTCTFCNKKFKCPRAFTKHVESKHGKTHKCVVCHKLFTKIEDLKTHMTTHYGDVLM